MRAIRSASSVGVVAVHAEQHEQARADGRDPLAFDLHRRLAHALHDRPHGGDRTLCAMAAVDVVDTYLEALPGETRRLAHGEWGVTLAPEQAAGWPLHVGLRLAEGVLHVQAPALDEPEGIDPWMLLWWNRSTRFVRFTCTRGREVWVQGDLAAGRCGRALARPAAGTRGRGRGGGTAVRSGARGAGGRSGSSWLPGNEADPSSWISIA